MTSKQTKGLQAPDGSYYVTLTDGAGSLSPAGGGIVSTNPNGQTTMADSTPVVIASNQTAVPASQSGTWTVQPGNTANTTAWKVDGSAVTQPVSGTVTNKPYSTSDWSYVAASGGISNTNTAVTIAGAAGASIRNYITGCQISSDALGTATEIAIRDGAGGTVLWRMKIGTGGLVNGLSVNFVNPLKGTANTLLEVVTLTASGTGAVYFNAQGYLAA